MVLRIREPVQCRAQDADAIEGDAEYEESSIDVEP